MWILQLNDMRSHKIEMSTTVCRAETKEELETFLERERVDSYKDDMWSKGYRKGGPLEWYNPPWDFTPHIIEIDYSLIPTIDQVPTGV